MLARLASMHKTPRRLAGMLFLLVMAIVTLIPLAHAQAVSVSLSNCGTVTVYTSDPYGSYENSFSTGETVYLTLNSQYPCAVYLTVFAVNPSGVRSTPVSNYQLSLSPSHSTVALFSVSPQLQSGQWSIIAQLCTPSGSCVDTPAMTININYSPSTPSAAPPPPYPSWLIPAVIVVVAAVIIGAALFVITRSRGGGERGGEATVVRYPIAQMPMPAPTTASSEKTRVGVALYRLILPNNVVVPVFEPMKIFGRETFEKFGVPRGVLEYISREDRGGHFRIYLRGTRWYIEDMNSTNGTLLNGVEIKGKGPQELKDGDVISPAGALNIVFKLEEVKTP